MHFTDRLRLEDLGPDNRGRNLYRLDQPLIYVDNWDNWTLRIEVPCGFVTDFASVPRFLWPFFPPAGKWNRAAVLHDYLYSQRSVSRFLADALFREAMFKLGVPVWRRVLMYYAVRMFGWAFREYRDR